jgi:acetylornithine deacetylase
MVTVPTNATIELLERLVALDSTSAVSNLPVLDACEQLLGAAGAVTERVAAPTSDHFGQPQPPKAGLLARIGPDMPGGVVLSGHTDCVPVEGQPWTTDPFVLTERDATLVGRGTTDMTGFLAAALSVAAPAAAGAALVRPLWFLLTWDEEVGTIGAGPMTDALLARTQPRAAIVGEPTSMRPAVAHKGVRSFRVTVTGREGHSSKPQLFANALVAASRIVCQADDVATELREEAADGRFDPPYTTFGMTIMRSGTAVNIIPREATLAMEYRPIPRDDSWALGDDIEAWARAHVLPGLRATAPESEISFDRGPLVQGLAPEEAGAAESLVRELTGFTGPAGLVPFGTDGGWHQAGGISTVVCGPGAIEQAHQPDEWITPSELASCETMLTTLVTNLEHA